MSHRRRALAAGMVLALTSGLALGVPGIAAAATNLTFASCPSFTTFQNDIALITGTATVTFSTAGCHLNATGSIVTQAGSDVTIDGNGLVVTGGTAAAPGSFDLFEVGSAASNASASDLTLDHVTASYGQDGIYQPLGNLTLTDSTISGNSNDGINQTDGGNVTITRSTITGNGNDGIYGNLTLTDSTISGNHAWAIVQTGSYYPSTFTDSTITGDQLIYTSGNLTLNVVNSTLRGHPDGFAGIFEDSFGGTVNIINSTISNASDAVYQISGTVNIINSTLVLPVIGGGVRQQQSGTINVTDSTITGPYGALPAIAQSKLDQTGTYHAKITGSLLADNAGNCDVPHVTDGGYNLSTDGSCGFSATGSRNNVTASDLKLGTVGDHGGPTPTLSLQPGSAAINAIPTGTSNGTTVCLNASGTPITSPASGNPIITDQRGVPRPQGAGCDIGAYEAITYPTTLTAADATTADTATGVALHARVAVQCGSLPLCPATADEGSVTFAVTASSGARAGTAVSGTVSAGAATATFVPTGLAPGTYTVTASYHDPAGVLADSQATAHLVITPGPAAHLTLRPGDTSAGAGTDVTETATVTDHYGYPVADGTAVGWSITGPGAATAAIASKQDSTTGGTAALTYTNTAVGTDSVQATAGTASSTATVTWTDTTPPVVSDVVATPGLTQLGNGTTLTATADDSNTGGSAIVSAQYSIDGGPWTAMKASDGSFGSVTEKVTAAIPAPSQPVAETLCVRATDAAGNTSDGSACTSFVVYDPAGGFVTGSGRINSPAGAYQASPSAAGPANFAFVSRYQKGATAPDGNTQFRFRAAGLVFHSTSYQWLVVNQAGTNAQFKGSGTLNGTPGYQFMIWATDGSPDTFRLQITDPSGHVVYDNGSKQPIASGSIIVHA